MVDHLRRRGLLQSNLPCDSVILFTMGKKKKKKKLEFNIIK